MIKLLRLLLVLALISISTHVFADFYATGGYCPAVGCYELSGEITALDALAVRAMVQSIKKTGKTSPLITLNSRGGDINAAMDIGRNLRSVRAIAIMGRVHTCYSACVFVLAGATQRPIAGSVGIHRPYSPGTAAISIEEAQHEYTRLSQASKAYLAEMNLPENLYEAMIRVPPEDMRLLSTDELAAFGLNKTDPVQERIIDSSYARRYGISMQEYLERKSISKKFCLPNVERTGDMQTYNACDERIMRTGR